MMPLHDGVTIGVVCYLHSMIMSATTYIVCGRIRVVTGML